MSGKEFSEYVAASPLAIRLQARGFMMETGSEKEEKDFGEGAVVSIDCGFATFRKGKDCIHVYQSRWSDSWALDVNGIRAEATAFLAGKEMLHDASFLARLMEQVDTILARP